MSRRKGSKTMEFLAQVTPDGDHMPRYGMMQPFREARVLRFGPFEFNLERRTLRKHGVRVKLQTQPFQILAALLEKPGTTVTRDELRKRLWPDNTFVDFDHGLNAAVARLRQALGDSVEHPRYIETVAKFGYRFASKLEGESEHLILRILEEDRTARSAQDMSRAAARSLGPARRLTVGRKKELAELRTAFESAATGRGAVLCIAGEAGIGKSTLLDDFSIRLRGEGSVCYIAQGRCSERLAGSEAYLPLLEALECLVRGCDPVARLLKLVAPTWYVQIAPHCLTLFPTRGCSLTSRSPPRNV